MRPWPRDSVVLGCDYNPEQGPDQMLDEDVELMAECGLGFVSLGIFSWALLEPQPERFEFAWLDRVMDRLGEAGIAVDLATATASPPPWFARLHPEAMPVTRDGVRLSHGSRQTWCPSSPAYRQRALALVEQLATRYHEHPALAMWHVNNEIGCHNSQCFCDVSAEHFRRWLLERHGDLDTVNQAWGTTFWSQRYADIADIVPPRATTAIENPGAMLDWHRFCSDALLAGHIAERDLLHRLSPGVPVTTNFMTMVAIRDMDYFSWAPHQDIVSTDHYLSGAMAEPHVELSLSGDLTRGLADGAPWVLMEHSTSAVNWQTVNLAKAPGQLARDSLAHVARGADAVGYFQWRASHAGAEKYHSALVPHAGRDSRVWREVVDLGDSLRAISEIAGSRVVADVALIWDWPSMWATDAPSKPSTLHRYADEVLAWYAGLRRAGVTTDIVAAGAELAGYSAVIVPSLHVMSEEAVAALGVAAQAGTQVLVTYFSGIVDERDHIVLGGYPGALRDLLGIRVEEFSPLLDGATVTLAAPHWEALDGIAATVWTERGRAAPGTEVLAEFSDGPAAGSPALTRRGTAWYVATRLGPDAVDAVLARVLTDAEVNPVLAGLPGGTEAVTRRHPDGREYLIVIDHTGVGCDIAVDGTDLVTGTTSTSGVLRLAPGAVAVVRRA